jgi:hypothetical protein
MEASGRSFKLQNPFVLRVGQVMTGFGLGCGLGIGVGVPIPMGMRALCIQSRVANSSLVRFWVDRIEVFVVEFLNER